MTQDPERTFAQRAADDAGMLLRSTDGIRWRILEHLRKLGDSIDTLQADYARAVGLHRTDLDAVTHLSDGPLTMGALGKRLTLTPGAVTGLVDRLERVGHVHRIPGTLDRRQTTVDLNPEAHRLIGEFFGALARRLMEQLEDYSDDDLVVIERFLADLPSSIDPAAAVTPE